MKKIIIFLLITNTIISCKTDSTSSSISIPSKKTAPVAKQKPIANDPKFLNDFFANMQGSYSSKAQSKTDKTYYYITLRMTPIWKNKGNYMYVEQSLFTKQNKPYRIKIYKYIQKNNNEIINEIYGIKNEQKWIGKYKNPKLFDALSEKDLELKQGCEVIFKREKDSSFTGKSGRKTCPSELRGAEYATSKITLTKGKMIAWDQGFDKRNKQVWGATKGGYILEKIIEVSKPKIKPKTEVKPKTKTESKIAVTKPVVKSSTKTTSKVVVKTPAKTIAK
ncbi:chromophore lyase CpcT/CpeT [Flavobacterium sp.]|uniref:chromophore lyase CpcT/CpeT n=1 Tax=Flavobacterium sp. TaxID=239 RepID=UPI00286D2972|nr:chromophore lyase CpcT/CpeT [Flavobacterium sp.]